MEEALLTSSNTLLGDHFSKNYDSYCPLIAHIESLNLENQRIVPEFKFSHKLQIIKFRDPSENFEKNEENLFFDSGKDEKENEEIIKPYFQPYESDDRGVTINSFSSTHHIHKRKISNIKKKGPSTKNILQESSNLKVQKETNLQQLTQKTSEFEFLEKKDNSVDTKTNLDLNKKIESIHNFQTQNQIQSQPKPKPNLLQNNSIPEVQIDMHLVKSPQKISSFVVLPQKQVSPPQIQPIQIEIEPSPQIPQPSVQDISKSNLPKEEKKNDISIVATLNHEALLIENSKKVSDIQKYYESIIKKVLPQVKDQIEGTIKKGIGHLYGSSMLRLYETAEEFIIIYETYKRSEEAIIFFATQIVKITLTEQVDSYFSQHEDMETMRDRLARIAILFHFINLHCPGLIEFVIGILTADIPLLIPKSTMEKDQKNLKKIEYYAYLYFCIICFDVNSFFSGNQIKEIEKSVMKKNRKSENFDDIMNNFLIAKEKMMRFLTSKGKISNYNEYYWKFVEVFFKLPINETTVPITISFCCASYFIWKKEGEKIVKMIIKLKDMFLPKLRAFNGQIKNKSQKDAFRINCNRLEEIVENVSNAKELPSFEEKKEEE